MSSDPIDRYLRKLRRRWWWRRRHGRLMAEVEDHLRSAAETYEQGGMSREDAARRAVDQLGPIDRAFRMGGSRVLACVGVVVVGVASTVVVVHSATGANQGAAETTRDTVHLSPREALLARIVAHVDLGKGSSVEIGSPPRGFTGGSRSWATVTVPSGEGGSEQLLGDWKTDLVAGTFRDLCRARGLAPFRGYTSGDGAGAGVVGSADHPPLTAMPTADSIAGNLERVGLAPLSIRLLHPGEGVAVQVAARVDDAAAFLRVHTDPADAVFGDLNTYAGTYLELVDTHGIADISEYATTASRGGEWRRPDLPPNPLIAMQQALAAAG